MVKNESLFYVIGVKMNNSRFTSLQPKIKSTLTVFLNLNKYNKESLFNSTKIVMCEYVCLCVFVCTWPGEVIGGVKQSA